MMSDVCNNIGAENIFRILVTLFFVTTATFVFMNLKKSVFVQIITMFLRLTGFSVIIMVTLASIRISNKAQYDIKPFRLQGLPKFFGVCLYSFMCQHSLPSMINYVQNKKARFNYWILLSMGIALCFYLVTLVTATLAFTGDELYNVYSMNFDKEGDTIFVKVLYYYLMIFPTIALSGSYPIVGITLRENLISFSNILLGRDINESLRKWIYPILAILPSYIIVMILPDRVSVLAGYVGAYAGSFVQYFIPACLVLWGRRTIMREFPNVNLSQNTHSFKIFRNMLAPIILIGWTFIGIGIVTYYYITK
ncbi:hypothetical protein HZS_6973 [Henneguya salminicola]|nr:hypothetical protein HZS_6973 [Henneguya salminicola]